MKGLFYIVIILTPNNFVCRNFLDAFFEEEKIFSNRDKKLD